MIRKIPATGYPYVSKDKILGKAVFRYWPITEMKTIK